MQQSFVAKRRFFDDRNFPKGFTRSGRFTLAEGNLLEKHGIKRKTVFVPECNLGQIRQYQYGFEADALHHVAGAGGHMANNMQILKNFEDKGKNYYNFKCS